MRVAFLVAALLLSVLLARPAWSAVSDAPATVGPFVTFCQTNFADCRAKITEIQLIALTRDLQNGTRLSCSVPRGIDPEAGAHAVVDWLGQHSESAGLATADGVTAAIRALWNCQEVATGVTSGGVPDKTDRFVAFCKEARNYVRCANKAVEVSSAALLQELVYGNSKHCHSPPGTTTEATYAKVIAWLELHPETYASKTEDGIAAAIDATFPCK